MAKSAVQNYLCEADWKKLQRLSGLPDEAREHVAGLIRFLQERPSPQKSPRELSFLQSRDVVKDAQVVILFFFEQIKSIW